MKPGVEVTQVLFGVGFSLIFASDNLHKGDAICKRSLHCTSWRIFGEHCSDRTSHNVLGVS